MKFSRSLRVKFEIRGTFKKMYFMCGIISHKGTDCCTLENNKDKRYTLMKNNNENNTADKKPKRCPSTNYSTSDYKSITKR
jgi:hypothetical protein